MARLSGDEFMVLLLGTNGAEAAARVAQKLLEALRPPLQVDGHELTTSASIGIALFPHDGDDADTLIKNADNALSRAKEQGRNHYQFYTDDMNAKAFERLMLESGLRRALEQGEFVIHYQPKVSLGDGAVTGVEALLRWYHPELGLVPPAEFIPLAEETGLIVPIGAWVLRTACAQVRRWQRIGHARLQLAVNISARQFQEKDFVPTVAAAVEDSGVPPRADRARADRERDHARRARRGAAAAGADGARDPARDRRFRHRLLVARLPAAHSRSTRSRSTAPSCATSTAIPTAPRSPRRSSPWPRASGSRSWPRASRPAPSSSSCAHFGCQELQGYIFSKPLPPDDLLALLDEGRRLAL